MKSVSFSDWKCWADNASVTFCFRTVPTTGALQHGWLITSTTRYIRHPVSMHAATISYNQRSHVPVCHCNSFFPPLLITLIASLAVYGEQQIRIALIIFLVRTFLWLDFFKTLFFVLFWFNTLGVTWFLFPVLSDRQLLHPHCSSEPSSTR